MAAFFMAGALPPGEMEDLCSFLLLPLLPCKLSSWRWALALPCGAWSICYGSDNAAAKSQGIKQLMAGGGIIVLGTTLIPLLSTLF